MKNIILKIFIFILPFNINAITLDETIKKTIDNNLQIKSAKYKFLAEKEQYSNAISAFLPNISASLSHNLNSDDIFSIKKKGISFNQQIFNFGGNLSAYKKGKILALTSKIKFLQKKQQVILDAIKSYTSVLDKEEAKSLHKHNTHTIKNHLDFAKQRFKLGETTKIEVEKSKSRLSSAISEEIRVNGELNNAYANYVHIVGFYPEELHEPINNLPITPTSLNEAISLAFINNLQMKVAKLTYESAEHNLEEAKAKFLPSISVNLILNQTEGINTQSAMLTTNIPLFQSGSGYFKLKQAKYSLEQSKENYYETKKAIEEIITIAWNNLITAKSVLESLKTEVESMSIVLESQKEAKKLNLKTVIDIIDAENDLLKTKKRNFTAKMQYIFEIYNIFLLTNDIEKLFK